MFVKLFRDYTLFSILLEVEENLDLPTSRSRIASGERRSREPRDRLVSLAGIWI